MQDQTEIYIAAGRAAFRRDPYRPIEKAREAEGIEPTNAYYAAFNDGWMAEQDRYLSMLSPRGRSNYRYRAKCAGE